MDEIAHRHGLSTLDWFHEIGKTIILLSKPEYRRDLGLAKIIPDPLRLCDDPACNRLNHHERNSPHTIAKYEIMKDLVPVKGGHPHEKGKYLCEICARVAMTKRIIDGKRDGAPLRI
jgi:hypothetical protein